MTAGFIRHGEDRCFKHYILGTTIWEDGPLYRVYPMEDDARIVFESEKEDDCIRFIEEVEE